MQLIVTAGAMTPAVAHDIQRRLTRRIMINLSSTEVGGWARTVVESDEDLTWYRVEPGREVEVVDDADQPLPTGQLGRVRVALRENTDRRGYWGDPQASAAFFKGRWFYSGDLGVLDGAGRLALYGRSTDVVAVEGDKLPAAAWEQALQARLGCDDICILSGRWGADGEEALHVFLESRRPIPAALLEQAVRETLFGFSGVRLHKLDALPRTPMGKVRRVALAQAIHEGRYPGA
jgi:acyl-coenzyme A synthetase/AMP-(fatty) acid ligase